MTELNLFLDQGELPPSKEGHPRGVHVLLEESNERTVMFVFAPNWATAYRIAPIIALTAWLALESSPRRKRTDNPADESFSMYMVRPGFPLDCSALWRESFSYYRNIPGRSAALAQSMTPVSGTEHVVFGRGARLDQVLSQCGMPNLLTSSSWCKEHPEVMAAYR